MAVAPEQQPASIHVLRTTLVPPASPSSTAPPESSLPLTFFDILWLHSPPVERLFFYRLAPDAHVPAILANLQDSLSYAIRAFYPLAGRLRLTPGTSNRYELYYCPGDAVTFTVAEAEYAHIDSLAADDHREVAMIAPLVPPLPEGGAVLALQATLLSARRGLALGVAVHHAACDGAASTHFLHTWAAACTGSQEPPPPPVIDRTLISDPSGLYDVFCQATLSREEAEFVKMSADQLLATFALSKDDLQRVKDAVAAEAATRGVAPPRCSSLVATLGLVWSCYQRACSKPSGGGDQTCCLLFPVDHRSRMKPPLPDKYLGNCVGPALGIASKGELQAAEGGLLSACTAVAAGIEEAVSGMGTSGMDGWMERIREVMAMGSTLLSVAGSPRFRVYDLDLGFGRPAKVDIVSVAKTGAIAVAESRWSGAGGMEVGVSLPPDGMDRFRRCFADALAGLASRSPEVLIQ